MSSYCVCCGSPLPSSHRHKTCSMCYGDPYWGTDGYMLRAMEEEEQREWEQLEAERQEAMREEAAMEEAE